MRKKYNKLTLDLDVGVIHSFDPAKHVLKRRKNKWIPVDKQVVRYEERRAKERSLEQEAQVEQDITKLFTDK